jgi:hypothetical protein
VKIAQMWKSMSRSQHQNIPHLSLHRGELPALAEKCVQVRKDGVLVKQWLTQRSTEVLES